nr:uncharacterized protein LOC124808067 [Hydra vulgaris]
MNQKSVFLCMADRLVSNQYPVMKGYYTKHLINEEFDLDNKTPRICCYCGVVFDATNIKFRILPKRKKNKKLKTSFIHITCKNCLNSTSLPCFHQKIFKARKISIKRPVKLKMLSSSTSIDLQLSATPSLSKNFLTPLKLSKSANSTPSSRSAALSSSTTSDTFLKLSKSAKKKARTNSFKLSHQANQQKTSAEPTCNLMSFLTSL